MTKRRRANEAPRRFEARGGHAYAIDPKAFFDFFMPPETRENERVGQIEIVDIEGPLEQRAGGWCDSYEAILARVQQACDSDAIAVVLRVDSPGGDCAGCFDTARAIRATCVKARKPLYTYVTDKACSAGYALASAATDGIGLSDSAIVGSIGVVSTREDVSAALAARGVRVALITSGARKADGHPESPITDDELAATQVVIDSVASVFFALIEETRGIAAATVAGFQAGVFHGDAAIRAELANVVQPYDVFLAAIAEGRTMATAYEKARASLEEAAKGEDANAAAAKRALAAMDEGNAPPDKKDDDAEGDDADKEAEGDDADKDAEAGGDDEPDGDEAPPKKKDDAASARASGELTALAEVHKLRAEITSDRVASERKALIASRKDFDPAMVKALSKPSTPIEMVRELVKTLPKGPAVKRPGATAATVSVAGTRGSTQGGVESLPPDEAEALDRAMGISTTRMGTRRVGNTLLLGVMSGAPETTAAAAHSGTGAK